MSQKTLYILYNADGTILGKLRYGYRKLSNKSDTEAACAACDITHGGLSLSESPNWVKAKTEIQSEGLTVVQLHRDEIDDPLREYLKLNAIKYPAVLLGDGGPTYTTIMTSNDLNACGGDPKALLEELRRKKVLTDQKPIPSL